MMSISPALHSHDKLYTTLLGGPQRSLCMSLVWEKGRRKLISSTCLQPPSQSAADTYPLLQCLEALSFNTPFLGFFLLSFLSHQSLFFFHNDGFTYPA